MKNENMPANPATGAVYKESKTLEYTRTEDNEDHWHFPGETKFEKAFWQVYSAMASNPEIATPYKDLAKLAINAVNSGFKALEARGNE